MSTAAADAMTALRETISRCDWEAALAAADAVPAGELEGDPGRAAELADLRAEAAWWLGRVGECIEARERAYRIFDELGDHRRAGQCAVWLFEHHAMSLRSAVAGGWLRRARRALEGDPECVEYGALVLREAEIAQGSRDLDEASALASEVLVLARRLRSADLEAEALQTKGRVLIHQGDVRQGMGHLDEAMLFAVEGRLRPYSTGKVYCSLISACEELGDLDRAAEWTEATMAWAQQHPFAIFPGICRVHRAVVLKRRGALAEAEREAAQACRELAGTHVGNSAEAHAEVGDICRRLGQLERAEEAFAQAQRLRGQPCGGLALLRLAQGRVDEAVSLISGCLSESTSNRLGRATLLPSFVQICLAAGDMVSAAESLVELDDIAAAFDSPILRATVLSTRGRLQLAQSDPAARTTLREAVEVWHALDVPFEAATARTLLGQALREAGQDEAATEAFATAAAVFDGIGAALEARLVYDDAGPSLPAGLSAREVEVLRLMATGRTNNEIARELYVSAKTVSRHASNIFTKIGVTSRAGATAFAFEHRLVASSR